jgi:thiamine pyrophosphokinase
MSSLEIIEVNNVLEVINTNNVLEIVNEEKIIEIFRNESILSSDFPQDYTLKIDEQTTYTYLGQATPGVLISEAFWQIKRVNNSTGEVLYAGSTSSFNKIWNNRESYSYG